MQKKVKKIAWSLLLVLFLMVAFNFRLLIYGFGQLQGQIKVLQGAQPIEQVLKQEGFPDSLKVKLHLIQEVKQFAEDSLGINKSNNYTSVYNTEGKPILWVVTACEKYSLTDYQWSFPILGDVSYKGFFDFKKAEEEQVILDQLGYDTNIREVTAWSTLGWFDDPILTNFLDRKTGNLSNLIIHELTHGTLYIKDNVTYNENLANFIGDVGAKRFLIQKYGKDSQEYQEYIGSQQDRELLTSYVLRKADSLEVLYKQWDGLEESVKSEKKEVALRDIFLTMKRLPFQTLILPKREKLPNNTYFMGYRRYHIDISEFEKEFNEKYNRNFHQYFASLKKKYGN